MKTVRQVLEEKGHDVASIKPDESVFEAIRIMAEKGIGSLVVTDNERLVGIISERDYARKVVLQGRTAQTTAVREIMTTRVVYARPEQTVQECMAVITDKRIRHLPVLDGTKLIGIISSGDLIKSMISEQQFIIEQLENYIAHG
jgi:CBS domain-containing protein